MKVISPILEAGLSQIDSNRRLPALDGSFEGAPDDETIVSYCRAGNPLSRYGDLLWDFSAYDPSHRKGRFRFSYWGNGSPTSAQDVISREMRRIVFCLIWRRHGHIISLGTLANYLIVLSSAAEFAETAGISLGKLFSCSKSLEMFSREHCSGWARETLGTLLSILKKLDEVHLGISLVHSKVIRAIKSEGKAYRAGIKQHAPIPTRLYSALISGLQQELEAWKIVSGSFLELCVRCGIDRFAGRTLDHQREVRNHLGIGGSPSSPTFEEVCPFDVIDYLDSAGKVRSLSSVSFLITEAQIVCKLIIQTFTGMRDDEVCALPFDCLETTVANGKTHYVVNGRTTKFSHGLPKKVRWVTNSDGAEAIRAAKEIARAIYHVIENVTDGKTKQQVSSPLFPSMGYLSFSAARTFAYDHIATATLEFRPNSLVPARLFGTITEEDLRELEQVDLHRAWRSEDSFSIGKRWSFKTHQLRRSLALYAQRSGLVSLPSLRRQLQHLTDEMSRYYSKGSTFAQNFIGENLDHFGKEWQETQAESEALSYILNVLMSEDALSGGHGAWVRHHVQGKEGMLLFDREATLRRFRKGEMAYRETLIGGCTNVGSCEQVAARWLDATCLQTGCKNMICNRSKLASVITAQARLVESIDPASIQFKVEQADLFALQSLL